MHRQIMHPPHGLEIDHKNNNGLDNRKCNLRFCTRSQNMANSRGHRRRRSSFKGVSFHKQFRKWRAIITQNKKNLHLGFFRSQVRAAKAYDDKAKELFGEFARPNFPYRLRRRNIYRWLMATNGRVFSVTFIKRSTGKDKTIRARLGVKTKINGKGMRYNTHGRKIILVFDINMRKYKCIPIEGIEAVSYRGRPYRVD